jgi:hypothetical protein
MATACTGSTDEDLAESNGAFPTTVGGLRWCEDVGEYWRMCELAAEAAAERAELEETL